MLVFSLESGNLKLLNAISNKYVLITAEKLLELCWSWSRRLVFSPLFAYLSYSSPGLLFLMYIKFNTFDQPRGKGGPEYEDPTFSSQINPIDPNPAVAARVVFPQSVFPYFSTFFPK